MIVNTKYGPMDDSELQRVDIADEDDNAHYSAVEYYLNGELVHRSAHVALKQGLNFDIVTQRIG